MIRATDVDIEVNLKLLSNLLWQKSIRHRINEESGRQVIWVDDEKNVELVRQLVENWDTLVFDRELLDSVETNTRKEGRSSANSYLRKILQALLSFFYLFRVAPVSLVLAVTCGIVALVTELGQEPYRLNWLFFPALPLGSMTNMLGGIDSPLVFLQTLTPMFLHFGELHIIFNLIWLWYFGSQLETVHSSKLFLVIVVVTSFAGNTLQFWYSQSSNFGGMSGVVYGLVGYAWILNNFVPGIRLMINNSMFLVFIAAMVITGFVAPSLIATAAHVGGFIAGLLAGLALLTFKKLGHNASNG